MAAFEVVLVGCGNIGTRLLQSLLTSVPDAHVLCIDPSEDARALAVQRASEVGHEASVDVAAEIQEGAAPDLAIVATTSAPRRSIVETLAARLSPKLYLLEKFLFPKIEDYAAVEALMAKSGARAYVHTPRPVWPGYVRLAGILAADNDSCRQMRVSGQQWNMASNAIHFVPAFEALARAPIVAWDASGLDADPVPNKRDGYLEVTGTLKGMTRDGAELILHSAAGEAPPLSVSLSTQAREVSINEAGGTMTLRSKADGSEVSEPFGMLRASEMQETFSALSKTGSCSLPALADLAAPHIALIRHFNAVFFGPGQDDKACPVT